MKDMSRSIRRCWIENMKKRARSRSLDRSFHNSPDSYNWLIKNDGKFMYGGCGNARCYLCHYEKFMSIPTHRDAKEHSRLKEEYMGEW